MNKETGIYIHIPFCASKCSYCDFYSFPAKEETAISYTGALCSQIEACQTGAKITSIYLGGGTPSVLPRGCITQVFHALSRFSICKNCEITVECNPDSANKAFFKELKACGINRVSMGVQSLDPRELKALGRRHTPEDVFQAVGNARNAGFDNLSLDLMLAVPFQTPDSLARTMEQMLRWSPEHLSAYLLKVEKGTPLGAQNFQPDEDLAADLYLQACGFLQANGYEHYEISNFAKPGKKAVHNAAYWQGKEYLAFGPGAYGYQKGCRYHYPKDVGQFLKTNGSMPATVDEIISEEEKHNEKLMLALRTSRGIKKTELTRQQNDYLATLCPSGLVRDIEERFSLTDQGFLVSNTILAELLETKNSKYRS